MNDPAPGTIVVLATILAMTVTAGAAGADNAATEDVAAAKAVVQQFATRLQGRLRQAIEEGGPVAGIEVCHGEAPAIAADLAAESGWSVGRTSLRTRNPSNAPDAWEETVLRDFQARIVAGEDPAGLVRAERIDGRFRFMKAIPTQPLCLACHGADLAPEVEAALVEYYPDDEARGYAVGDLRGAFTLSRGP